MKDRVLRVGLICAGALCSGSLLAGGEGAVKERAAKPDREAKKFEMMDANADGVISLDEFKAVHARREEAARKKMGDAYDAERAAKKPSAEDLFKKLDTDATGGLSKDELTAGNKPAGPKVPRGGAKKPKDAAAVNPPL